MAGIFALPQLKALPHNPHMMGDQVRMRVGGQWRTACLRLFSLCLFVSSSSAEPQGPKLWRAGNYVFSDEKGGFAIRAVSGVGTRENPIVIEQELYSGSPVTMVIRDAGSSRTPGLVAGDLAASALFLQIQARNASGSSWLEFVFELQEHEGKASIFSDGLSFDQKDEEKEAIGSDAFRRYNRDFEPYDQLRFTEGKIDVGQSARFDFALADFTPIPTFYLVEDPRIPYS